MASAPRYMRWTIASWSVWLSAIVGLAGGQGLELPLLPPGNFPATGNEIPLTVSPLRDERPLPGAGPRDAAGWFRSPQTPSGPQLPPNPLRDEFSRTALPVPERQPLLPLIPPGEIPEGLPYPSTGLPGPPPPRPRDVPAGGGPVSRQPASHARRSAPPPRSSVPWWSSLRLPSFNAREEADARSRPAPPARPMAPATRSPGGHSPAGHEPPRRSADLSLEDSPAASARLGPPGPSPPADPQGSSTWGFLQRINPFR